MKAAIYCRISRDSEGLRAGVERQEADCRAHVERRGWEVAAVFIDNDLSAYSGKPRPAYERMLAAVERGDVQAIVAWHNDRLHRSPAELERFIDVVERHNVTLAMVEGGDYDLTTSEGRFQARVLGAVARKESEDKSRRLRRKHLDLAEKGLPSGFMGFGFGGDDEADLVREAAERVLAGESVRRIVADWNARGLRTSYGKPWNTTGLRRLLIAPRIAGLREHHGKLRDAAWAPIVDKDTWHELQAILTAPERTRNGGVNARRYLLSGFIYCGLCGRRLHARPRADKTRQYVCISGPDFEGCGKIKVVAEPLESFAEQLAFNVLSTTVLLAVKGSDQRPRLSRFAEQQRNVERRIEALDEARYIAETMDDATYHRLRGKLEAEAARLVEQETAFQPVDRRFSLEQLLERWGHTSLAEKRELIGRLVKRVIVGPVAVRGRNKFDPDRIDIEWNDDHILAQGTEYDQLSPEWQERLVARAEAAGE